ncbi:MAG: hypothetical protein GY861_28860 [bacterium]|nr:hypothetical protein [bacterium]
MLIIYSSNNSGGSWWLKDEDWLALEKAGWKVAWVRGDTDSLFSADKDGRWLGALATTAEKEFETFNEAIEEFEIITGQDASDPGCSCCGQPHMFDHDRGV